MTEFVYELMAVNHPFPQTRPESGSGSHQRLLCAAQLSISNLSSGRIKCHFSFKEKTSKRGPHFFCFALLWHELNNVAIFIVVQILV